MTFPTSANDPVRNTCPSWSSNTSSKMPIMKTPSPWATFSHLSKYGITSDRCPPELQRGYTRKPCEFRIVRLNGTTPCSGDDPSPSSPGEGLATLRIEPVWMNGSTHRYVIPTEVKRSGGIFQSSKLYLTQVVFATWVDSSTPLALKAWMTCRRVVPFIRTGYMRNVAGGRFAAPTRSLI